MREIGQNLLCQRLQTIIECNLIFCGIDKKSGKMTNDGRDNLTVDDNIFVIMRYWYICINGTKAVMQSVWTCKA